MYEILKHIQQSSIAVDIDGRLDLDLLLILIVTWTLVYNESAADLPNINFLS
jgi:hypothetical protein